MTYLFTYFVQTKYFRQLFLIALFLAAYSAHAQKTFKVATVGNNSDYQIKVKFDNLPDYVCSCTQGSSIMAFGSSGAVLWTTSAGFNTSWEYDHVVGPGTSYTYNFMIQYYGTSWNMGCTTPSCNQSDPVCPPKNCSEIVYGPGAVSGTTTSLKTPVGVTASDSTSDSYIELKWTKGTDVPDAMHQYYIYKDYVQTVYAIVDGNLRSWKDYSVEPGEKHTYQIATYTSSWGGKKSDLITVNGSTFGVKAVASDSAFDNRVLVTWKNLSLWADEVKVERSANGTSFEELAIVSKSATSYSDYNGIPGFTYTYRITPLKTGITYKSSRDQGTRQANGKISGDVKTRFGAGVKGATIKAESNVLVNGVYIPVVYTAITDAAGHYEIPAIYYHQSAKFKITPSRGNHGFDPSVQERTLDLVSSVIQGVNFTDTTLLTVAGRVYFPVTSIGDTCWIKGVNMMLNGKPTAVKTDNSGAYELAIEKEGLHTITPDFKKHNFLPVKETIDVRDDMSKVDFVDNQKDTLTISLKGGCKNIVADYATFYITSTDPGSCFKKTVTSNASGVHSIILPAQEYRVEIKSAIVKGTNDPNIVLQFDELIKDLSQRDSAWVATSTRTVKITPADTVRYPNGAVIITPADTVVTIKSDSLKQSKAPTAAFIYHSKISIDVLDLPAPVCLGDGKVTKVAQNDDVMMGIEVKESYTYTDVSCPVDSGTIKIYDDVSGRGVVSYPIRNGGAFYTFKPGKPNISSGGAHPYQKLIQVEAKVGYAAPVTRELWMLVTGHSPRTQTFVTKTPELPFFVLHDPVGDKSYSFLEKDSSFTYSYTNKYQVGGGAGAFLDLKIGAGIPVPFTGIVLGASSNIKASLEDGRTDGNKNSITTTFTAQKRFSTSDDELFVGQGDVFVGASFNMIYALTDVIDYDAKSCEVNRDTSLAWGANGIATTYMYSEGHIRNTLLTQLNTLKNVAKGDSVKLIESYIKVWEQLLAKNDKNKKEAAFVENLSFSAGLPYDKSITTENDSTIVIDYKVFLNLDASISAILGDGGKFANTEFGVSTNFRWESGVSKTYDYKNTKSIGYHLEDNDPGDFFSVDVMKDKVYGTPVFKLSAGTSSCPNEAGTQIRDKCELSLSSYVANNVPANQAAVFTANLSNISESDESWNYAVRAVSSSNLDGAVIKLGGQAINNNEATFFIPSGRTASIALTVEKGPLANDYEDLQVILYSPCEYELWQNGYALQNADTVTFSVHFQGECSPVEIYDPGDNWLVNSNDNNKLNVTFTGYNSANPNFQDIKLQYKKVGTTTWTSVVNIHKSLLTDKYFGYAFDVKSIPDGNYEIRALANCGALNGVSYSKVLTGKIERKPPVTFGLPTPSDGVLNVGEAISINFSTPINCDLQYDPPVVTLTRNDTKASIPVTVNCSGSKILIETKPASLINSLENVELTASVGNLKDLYNNRFSENITWSFLVNLSPVYWDPSNISITSNTGNTATVPATLKNTGGTSESFTLSSYPAWLAPSALNGSIPAGGNIPVSFTLSANLDPGHYEDSVIAIIDGTAEVLFVKADVITVPELWSVNPAKFSHSMTMTAQFTFSDNNVPLSSDPRDMIGAFVNGQCRGVANIEYVPALNVYVAFLTIYSNTTFGDSLVFKMWDALPGTEYLASEKMVFMKDASVGRPLAPKILHPAGVTQTIPFKEGWNWFSLNVSSDNMSAGAVLSNLKSATYVKSQTNFSEFKSNSGWSGSLDTLDNKSGYMIFLTRADTLHFTGTRLANVPSLAVDSGWSWIGYPRQGISGINTVLSPLTASANDVIKSQTSFANYDTDSKAWIGSLKFLHPGSGYKLSLGKASTLAFSNSIARISSTAFEINKNLYEHNMTITAALKVNNISAQADYYVIGAFINNVCRGIAPLEKVGGTEVYRGFISVLGNSADAGSPIVFKVLDTRDGETEIGISEQIIFTVDDTKGKIDAPIEIYTTLTSIVDVDAFNGYDLAPNYPNPFNKETVIEYTIPKNQQVVLTLYSNLGVELMTLVNEHQSAGLHTLLFDSSELPEGVYLYKLQAGDYSKTRRMSFMK